MYGVKTANLSGGTQVLNVKGSGASLSFQPFVTLFLLTLGNVVSAKEFLKSKTTILKKGTGCQQPEDEALQGRNSRRKHCNSQL